MYSESFGLIQFPIATPYRTRTLHVYIVKVLDSYNVLATPYRTSQCIELCMYSEGFGFLAKDADSYNVQGLASAMDVMELCKHSIKRL